MHITDDMVNSEVRLAGRAIRRIIPQLTPKWVERMNSWTRGSVGKCSSKRMRYEQVFIPCEGGGELRLCVYTPLEPCAGGPGVLQIHGGGYAYEWPETEASMCERFIGHGASVVVSPDYRKSVEAPYPAALEDCYAALRWLAANGGQYGMRSDQVFVAGGSAGGGQTAAVTLYARDRSEVAVAFQMPLYPMIDDRMITPSSQDNDAPLWNTASNELAWKMYLGDLYGTDGVPAYAAPARAEDLSGLPPTLSYVGSIEPFRDETRIYMERIAATGTQTFFQVYEGCWHGFELVQGASVSKDATAFFIAGFEYARDNYFAEQPDLSKPAIRKGSGMAKKTIDREKLRELGVAEDVIDSLDPRDGGNVTPDGEVLFLDEGRREAKVDRSRPMRKNHPDGLGVKNRLVKKTSKMITGGDKGGEAFAAITQFMGEPEGSAKNRFVNKFLGFDEAGYTHVHVLPLNIDCSDIRDRHHSVIVPYDLIVAELRDADFIAIMDFCICRKTRGAVRADTEGGRQMPSIRGRFYAAMQRRTSNINPFVHEDPAARIASLGNATLSEKLPKGIDVEWGFDPADIVVGGDSAGGNLALALMLKLRDAGEKMPAGGFFLSPWGDMTASGASYFGNYGADPQFGQKGKTITPEELDAYINSSIYCWIGDSDRADPYVSPTLGDYRGFPPMLFCTGGAEMLLSDTLTIVGKCKAAGVPVQLDAPEGMFHIYATYDGFMPEATRAWKMVEDFVVVRLGANANA